MIRRRIFQYSCILSALLAVPLMLSSGCKVGDFGASLDDPPGGGSADASPPREPVIASIAAGSLAPLGTYTGITGRAQIQRTLAGQTIVDVHVAGLMPATEYPSHVHMQPCNVAAGGGHYKIDPTILDTVEENEIWPAITTNEAGIANHTVSANHLARADALSVVIHDPLAGNAKMACADLMLPQEGSNVRFSGQFAPFAAAEAQDMTLAGSAELALSGAGTSVNVNVQGADPATIYHQHVHELPCEVNAGGSHYKIDPTIADTIEENELWPRLTVAADGSATATLTSPHVSRGNAQSVIIHREITPGTTPKVACANLTRDSFIDLRTQGTATLLPFGTERYPAMTASAQMTRSLDGRTRATLTVSGVAPNVNYGVHVHEYACALESGGGHYKIDPGIADTIESNELWLNFTSDGAGSSSVSLDARHLARPEGQSIVIHDEDKERLACIDLL